MGENGLVGLGLSTVTTLACLSCSAAILAQERGIALHSLLSPLPSLPNGEMLREQGGVLCTALGIPAVALTPVASLLLLWGIASGWSPTGTVTVPPARVGGARPL